MSNMSVREGWALGSRRRRSDHPHSGDTSIFSARSTPLAPSSSSMAAAASGMQSNVDPQTVLNYMREQCTDLSMKINTMDLDKTEHELVINALEPLPADRKCYRMIGSVVVERTVGEVLPAVKKNREQVRTR